MNQQRTAGSGTIEAPALAGKSGIEVSAQIVDTNYVIQSRVLADLKLTDTTDAQGYFELSLAKGARFRIVGSYTGKPFLSKVITVTNDATKDIATYA